MTEEQYLALERAAEFRSEFLDGRMFPRAASSLQHARLNGNILYGLDAEVRRSGNHIFSGSLRVKVSAQMYAYPDATVVCGTPLTADHYRDILLNPTIVFEVLSAETEVFDRGTKAQKYRALESIKEYVLVSQDHVLLEHYARRSDGTWDVRFIEDLNDELKLASVGATLPLHQIYDLVEFPAP